MALSKYTVKYGNAEHYEAEDFKCYEIADNYFRKVARSINNIRIKGFPITYVKMTNNFTGGGCIMRTKASMENSAPF